VSFFHGVGVEAVMGTVKAVTTMRIAASRAGMTPEMNQGGARRSWDCEALLILRQEEGLALAQMPARRCFTPLRGPAHAA
jgi:hypothetical protein